MKSRSPLINVAVGLVGILIVSVGLIMLGSRESHTFPSADSYLPSGSSALAELLRHSHYQVVVDHKAKPDLRPNDLVIAFTPNASLNLGFISSEGDIKQIETTKETISAFVKGGGRLISLPVSPDFSAESRRLYDAQTMVVSTDGTSIPVTWDESDVPSFYLESSATSAATSLWSTVELHGRAPNVAKTAFVRLANAGSGLEANIVEGVIATNRFIDRQQNAYVIADVVGRMAKPGGRIVIAEATFGNASQPGLLETIGPWALAAWLQLLFLGIVIAYTLGKPFGLPDPERRQERGARDLMDAMADTLRRGRMTKLALRTVVEDTNRLLRKMYRSRVDTDRASEGMTDLQRKLNKVEAAAEIGAPESMAAKLIQDVESQIPTARRGAQ